MINYGSSHLFHNGSLAVTILHSVNHLSGYPGNPSKIWHYLIQFFYDPIMFGELGNDTTISSLLHFFIINHKNNYLVSASFRGSFWNWIMAQFEHRFRLLVLRRIVYSAMWSSSWALSLIIIHLHLIIF